MSGGDEAKSYLVECYWPGVGEDKLARATARAQRAASELRRQGRELQFRGAILVPADETVFCLFDGQEDDVRAASEQAGIPFERVLESLRIDGSQAKRRGARSSLNEGETSGSEDEFTGRVISRTSRETSPGLPETEPPTTPDPRPHGRGSLVAVARDADAAFDRAD